MRSFLRKAAAISASAAIICFCSCERHHADELHGEAEHGKSKSAAHEHANGEADKHHHEGGDSQTRATTAMSVTPPPARTSPTPAEFFPQSTPR